jgi:hypothetical protein
VILDDISESLFIEYLAIKFIMAIKTSSCIHILTYDNFMDPDQYLFHSVLPVSHRLFRFLYEINNQP